MPAGYPVGVSHPFAMSRVWNSSWALLIAISRFSSGELSDRSGRGSQVVLCTDLVGQIITGQHPVEQRRCCIPVIGAEGMALGDKGRAGIEHFVLRMT